MRVDVNPGELLQELVDHLRSARCLVRPLGETSCLVVPLEARDAGEALVELRFFVAAWASGRPGVVATVSA